LPIDPPIPIYQQGPEFVEGISIHHSDGKGNFNPPIFYPVSTGYGYINNHSTFGNFIVMGDFDGDSQADYITFLSDQTNFKLEVSFPGNNSLNNSIDATFIGGSITNKVVPLLAPYLARASFVKSIDYDGDGKSEILFLYENDFYVYSIEKVKGQYVAVGKKVLQIDKSAIIDGVQFGDFNADGNADLVLGIKDSKVKSTNLSVYYSDANKFVLKFPNILPPSVALNSNSWVKEVLISDYNGDGLSDICVYVSKGSIGAIEYSMYYSQGSKLVDAFYTLPYKKGTFSPYERAVTGDFNGDGKSEILHKTNDIARFFPNATNNLLEKVVDGYNREVVFGYENATAGTIFTKGVLKKPIANVNNVQLPMYMASKMIEPDGVGGQTFTTYKYSEAWLYRRGLGFLGCGQVTTNNSTTGIETISQFGILTGNLSNGKTALSTSLLSSESYKNNKLISRSTNNTNIVALSNGRQWEKTDNSESNDFITGAYVKKSYKYDAFGNVTTEDTDNSGVEQTRVSIVYKPFGSWIPSSPVTITTENTRGASKFSKIVENTYNTQGGVTKVIEFPKNAKELTTDYEINLAGLVKTSTLSASTIKTQINKFTYDKNFRFVEVSTNPLGQNKTIIYDKRWSKAISVTDIDGLTTGFQYDGLGRLILTRPPQGYDIKTSYNWELSGNALYNILVEHPGKPDTREHFDIFERSYAKEIEGFKKKWLHSSKVFDNKGKVIRSYAPQYGGNGVETILAYDPLERLKSSKVVGIGTTDFEYSYNNGETKVVTTTPAKHIYESTTDATGKTIKKKDDGGVLTYKYDGQGNQTIVELDGKETVRNTYDGVGHRILMKETNGGTTSYVSDALGRLLYEKSARNFITTYEYDIIGRPTFRNGKEGITEYKYKKSGGGINKIEFVKNYNGYTEATTYDAFGRVVTYTENVDGKDFTHQYKYDIFDNTRDVFYPTDFAIHRDYDDNSYLEKVTDLGKGTVIFSGNQIDEHGNYTNYDLGNSLTTINQYDQFGFPVNFSTKGASDLDFTFDVVTGNLENRKDNMKGLFESFEYDQLDRLTKANNVSSGTSISTSFTNRGNITNKSDAGSYEYASAKVNAVTKINEAVNISLARLDVQYMPFEQPDEIKEQANRGTRSLNFKYGADYQRRIMEYRTSWVGLGSSEITYPYEQAILERRYYQGDYEEDHIAPYDGKPSTPEITRQLHYIQGGDGLCAIMVRTIVGNNDGVDSIFYVHKDYLGSLLTFTGEEGNIVYEQNFDAWGRYRNIKDWSYVDIQHRPKWMYRGYTGHEHLSKFINPTNGDNVDPIIYFDLINMNGRLYDPVMGRMLSVDEYLHDDAGSQGYNGYTYALNNPLKYSDPDGEIPFFITPQVSWSKSGGLYAGLEIGVGIPGVLSASVSGGYSFGSKQWSASIQGSAGGFYAGYGTGGAFAGFGFHAGYLGAGITWSEGNGFGAGISLGSSHNDTDRSFGLSLNQENGWDVSVGASRTYEGNINIPHRRPNEFAPKNTPNPVGGVKSEQEDCCPIAALVLNYGTKAALALAVDPVPGDEVVFETGTVIVAGIIAVAEKSYESLYDYDYIVKSKKYTERAYDDLPQTMPELDSLRRHINRNSNGRPSGEDAQTMKKIITQEKLIGKRNFRKRQ
jgi:RHS repeat-associated protein